MYTPYSSNVKVAATVAPIEKMLLEKYSEADIYSILEKVLHISKDNMQKDSNGFRLKEKIELTVEEYCVLMLKGFVNKSIKTNRPDVNNICKKQGIIETLTSDDDLPNLIASIKWNDGKLEVRVTDGGHRSRSFSEFIADQFSLSRFAFHVNSSGRKVPLHGMTASDMCETNEEAFLQFMSQKLSFTVFHNSTANEDARSTQNLNKGSNHNPQEHRNTLDDNVVAEFIRNTCREIEELNNTPHRLFGDNLIRVPAKRLKHDEILTRFMLMLVDKTPSTTITEEKMDDFFREGSIEDSGKWYIKNNDWQSLMKDCNKYLDIFANIYDHYPKNLKLKDLKNSSTNFTALQRFLLQMEYDLNKNSSEFIIQDYKKFAASFVKMLETIYRDETLNDWLGDGKWTKAKAFKKYLGQFNVLKKTNYTIKWMMEVFNERYEDFGILVKDKRVTFRPNDVYNRYVEVGGCCEACDSSIEQADAQGDHDIPRSWGVAAGGVTEVCNLRLLCSSCNRAKSDKYTFEEFKKTLLEAA